MDGVGDELDFGEHVILGDHGDELVLGAEHVVVKVQDDQFRE